MQYVRSIGGTVSKTWNSINPANLSGAIDVIVVEDENGELSCSPFHVRFGKFSLLRPSEKKVDFKVNGVKQDYAMKLGDGGEAFFVMETWNEIPSSFQTSPIGSPAASPPTLAGRDPSPSTSLQEPSFLDIATGETSKDADLLRANPGLTGLRRAQSSYADLTPRSISPETPSSTQSKTVPQEHIITPLWKRSNSAELIPTVSQDPTHGKTRSEVDNGDGSSPKSPIDNTYTPYATSERSNSPPPLSRNEAYDRAMSLSKKLKDSKIPTQIHDSGDLMLDMTGYKTKEEDAIRAEAVARKLLADELEGNYDIGALIGADEKGNIWIYGSEESKEAAQQRLEPRNIAPGLVAEGVYSVSGHRSDDGNSNLTQPKILHKRTASDAGPSALISPPQTPPNEDTTTGDPNKNYAKTIRLTSDQLKALELKPGSNTMSFSVNRATCSAFMHYWKYDVPVVISDIDGTITKSDAIGHMMNLIGRDWTHVGVAKLYTDIVANGFNILYLTSRSVGQADTTRTYLQGILQEGFRLPKGPVILSPDRTMAALKREVYLRKPEVFKMACLRDIQGLFGQKKDPFYAGFGNRFTDAMSYRSVGIPSTRIFTINSSAEVSLDLLTLNTYRSSYVSMRDLVDHFFPPLALLVSGEHEEYTDFKYWRDSPQQIDVYTDSEEEEEDRFQGRPSIESVELDDTDVGEMGDSYISRGSAEDGDPLMNRLVQGIARLEVDDDEVDLIP